MLGQGGLLAGWGISPKTSELPRIPVPGREPPFAGTVRGVPGAGGDSRCSHLTRTGLAVPTQGCSRVGGREQHRRGLGLSAN